MKVGFVVTAHWSDKYRPRGGEYIKRFTATLIENCKYPYHIYVIDNASMHELDISDSIGNMTYIRIDDQTINGITGAWNTGLHTAYMDGCTILVNCNDDLWFNDTINNFINVINDFDISDDVIFCPLTNGVLGGNPLQKSEQAKQGITKLDSKRWSTAPNGFMFGMTRVHYEKYRYTDMEYFNKDNKYNGGDGKWGGQEGQFIENSSKGLYGIIINECWIPHDKERGWKQLIGK